MKIINTFKDKKITLLVVFLILFINITAYSQNTNDGGTTNTASTTLVEKEQKRKDSCELKAKPITSVSKETATNEQEDEEDWVVENDGNWAWLWINAFIISIALSVLIYHLCVKKLYIENKGVLVFPCIFLAIFTFFMIIALNGEMITKRKTIKTIVIGKSKRLQRGWSYYVQTEYKGIIFTHFLSEKNYNLMSRKDTFCFEVCNGLWGTNIINYKNAKIKHYKHDFEPYLSTKTNFSDNHSRIKQDIPDHKQLNNSGNQPEIKLDIPDYKQYIINNKLLLDDLNSQVSLAENSKGHIYIEFSLSSPLMSANDIKILSGNKKAKDEFIKFISNLNNCGKVSESGKYVLYCEFDKGKIHKADLTKTD